MGAKLLVVPAAFNMTTGPVRWHLSVRARALESHLFKYKGMTNYGTSLYGCIC